MRQLPLNLIRNKFGVTQITSQWWDGSSPRSSSVEEVIGRTIVIKTPAFTEGYGRLLKSRALLPHLPYHVKRHVVNYPNGKLTESRYVYMGYPRGYGWFQYWHSDGLTNYFDTPVWHEKFLVPFNEMKVAVPKLASDMATTALLLNAKDQKINVAVAAAEFNQVLTMVTKFATTTQHVITSLRKGELLNAAMACGVTVSRRRATRYRKRMSQAETVSDIDSALANGILQVQYGIRPLIQDVIGAAEHLAQKNLALMYGFAKSRKRINNSMHVWSDNEHGVKTESRGVIDVAVGFDVTFSTTDAVHHVSQLGITNPLAVAWELVPWSFVIDWVIPIGDAINSLDATLGLAFRDGSKSTRVLLEEVNTQYISTNSGYTRVDGSLSSSEYLNEFNREKLSSFPGPVLPSFKNPLSREHALNAVSLLVGLKKKIYADIGK